MAYVLMITDRAGVDDLRARHKDAHYAYLETNRGKLLFRGGMKDEATGAFIGGLLILDVETREEAEGFLAADPFAQAGMLAEFRIERLAPAYCAPSDRWR